DKGKRSTQPRVAAMAKQHGQMTIVEIGDAAAEIAGLSTTPRSNVYAFAIAVHPSMGWQTHRYAAFVAPRSDADSPRGAFSRMRAEKPQSRRHSTAISASSRGIWRTRAPLVTLRETLRPSVSAAACAFAGIAISTRSVTRISPSQCCQQTPHEWVAAGTLLATRRDRASGDISR